MFVLNVCVSVPYTTQDMRFIRQLYKAHDTQIGTCARHTMFTQGTQCTNNTNIHTKHSICMEHGVWGMEYGVWDMEYGARGTWFMVYDVWCMMYGVWCVVYGVWCMVYGVWCNTSRS